MPEGFDPGENGHDFIIIDYKLADIECSFTSARPLLSGPPPDCPPCRTPTLRQTWLYLRVEAGRHSSHAAEFGLIIHLRAAEPRGLGIAPNLLARGDE